MKQGKVLVLTVGTGNLDDLEGSLLMPLAKSLKDGEWSEAVLLPSTVTERSAERLRKRFGTWIRVETLPSRNMENDYDDCFGYFDGTLAKLFSEGYRADQIVVDFTRGTKAMSAAAVLAAVRREVPVLRYMHGDRDSKGTVIPGTEKINEVRPELAVAHRDLDRASDLMSRGSFAAVLEVLERLTRDLGNLPESSRPREELLDEVRTLRRRAEFFATWDRLDYGRAARLAKKVNVGKAAEWVRRLAKRPDMEHHGQMAEWLCAVACDLLENGRRRLRDQHLEDARLRGYRVLELLGQIRLFDNGHNSSSIDPHHPDIEEAKSLPGRHRPRFSGDPDRPTAGRVAVALLLKHLGDDFGDELLELGQQKNGFEARNESILIHGFETFKPERRSLEDLYVQLEQLLRRVRPERHQADTMLALARLADLGRHHAS